MNATRPVLAVVKDGPLTTTHAGAPPTVEDCGCELGTPVQQTYRHGPVCTGCGKRVEQ